MWQWNGYNWRLFNHFFYFSFCFCYLTNRNLFRNYGRHHLFLNYSCLFLHRLLLLSVPVNLQFFQNQQIVILLTHSRFTFHVPVVHTYALFIFFLINDVLRIFEISFSFQHSVLILSHGWVVELHQLLLHIWVFFFLNVLK